uniref:Uncharacterized protein At1g51745 family n=1 Tax=Cajanus cajan TaxID=3821 RepID=A0A151SGY9_CAJCA|nr:Uncharacterized protein At1g51745 family [Cajanus cajan]
MGSSGESNMNGIDASVGGLVWVRRRNGSWWPGRIMGHHELSESCLVSPRSGTPVKLLGREDASVDWYNLEKSKRVKAFRCGEYDECIEKAKASAANSNKKAVKYARREDAILHALELESAHLDKEPLSLCSRLDKSDDNEDVIDDPSDSDDNSNSAPELSQSGISFEEPNHNGSLKMQSVQGRRRRTPNDSEDDGSEGVKRMRGLEDLGIGVMSKRKVQGNCLANGTSVNGGKGYSATMKRKRSQVANAPELLKRKSRRRPLTKVLESTAMVSVPVICDQLLSSSSSPLCGVTDGRISGLDSNDSKKTFPVTTLNSDGNEAACENGTSLIVHDHGSDDASQINHGVKENETSGIPELVGKNSPEKLFDVPFVGVLGEEKRTLGMPQYLNFYRFFCVCKVQCFSSVLVSCSSGKPQVSALGQPSCNATAGHNIGHRADKSSSKWQSKGKRKSRHTSKNIKQLSRKYEDTDHQSSAYLPGIGNSDGIYQGADFPGRNHCSDASLYDVKLEVKSSYRPQHVPLVSLVSKLNGKAFIGHPLTVEVLDEGHCDKMLSGIGCDLEASDVYCVAKPKLVSGRIRSKNLRRLSSKSSKMKKSGLSNKKIRKLSSLTGHRQSEEGRKPVVDKLKGPVIACIPLTLVFSRIHEAVSGQARSTHRAIPTSNP